MSDSGWGTRRNVAPYLGVTIVVVIGFWGILVPLLMAFPDAPTETVVVVSAGLAVLVSILWAFTPASELPSSIYSWVLSRKQKGDELEGYEPLTKRVKRSTSPSQRPPSVEEIRGIRDSSNNWVPTGTQAPKRIVRSQRLGPTDRPSDSPRRAM